MRQVLLHTKLMVLIRPRGGDLVYTADELQVNELVVSCWHCWSAGEHCSKNWLGVFSYCHPVCVVQVMLADVRACKELNAHGVVVGCLQPDGSIDTPSTRQLVQEAQAHVGTGLHRQNFATVQAVSCPLPTVFHP